MRRLNTLLVIGAILALLLTAYTITSTPAFEPSPGLAAGLTPSAPQSSRRTPQPTATHLPAPTPTPTHLPTSTPTATPTPTPTPFPFPIPTYPPNEQGDIMVLAYHRIDLPEGRWTRPPEDFRRDLETLLQHGYYPVNLIDVVHGNLDYVPRGRRPIVLTFDDSTIGQYRYLSDGSLDPDCAVGIIKAMHDRYGDEHWPMRATFFVQVSSGDKPGGRLFRQSQYAAQKARKLIKWGMEIGSHSITHPDFSQSTAETIKWELAVSQERIEAILPDYRVRSFCPPYGAFPTDRSLLQEGHSDSADLDYSYDAVVRSWGGPAPSPYSDEFNPYFVPRVPVTTAKLDKWIAYYDEHPERYYVSDGGQEEEILAGQWR